MVCRNKSLAFVLLFGVGCAPAVLDFGSSLSTTTNSTTMNTETTGTTSSTSTNTTSTFTSTSTSTTTTIKTTDPKPSSYDWEGSRYVHIDSCDEYMYEEGFEITMLPEYQDIVDACSNCDHVFFIEVDPPEVCGYPVSSPIVRGIEWESDGDATVHQVYEDGGSYESVEYADASVDGTELSYLYDGGWYYADGEITLVPQF